MHYPNPIAARSRRGKLPGATGAPRQRLSGWLASLIMLAALAVRLASMMPGVPVLHWHGSIAVVHAGGGFAHGYGEGACGGGGDGSSNDDQDVPGQTYYSPADIPARSAADAICLLCDVAPRGVNLLPTCVWRDAGARSPGPTRGPPRH